MSENLERISEESSALVFLHTYEKPDGLPTNEKRLFARIPTVGEHVALSEGSDYYRVYLVVHTPFEDAEVDAEVYALKEGKQSDIVSGYLRTFGQSL